MEEVCNRSVWEQGGNEREARRPYERQNKKIKRSVISSAKSKKCHQGSVTIANAVNVSRRAQNSIQADSSKVRMCRICRCLNGNMFYSSVGMRCDAMRMSRHIVSQPGQGANKTVEHVPSCYLNSHLFFVCTSSQPEPFFGFRIFLVNLGLLGASLSFSAHTRMCAVQLET